MRYSRLNLTRNPFGALTLEEWIETAVLDLPPLCAHIRPGVALQLLAPPGRGKTTHLLSLWTRLPHARYVRLGNQVPPARAPIWLIDEADLSLVGCWRYLRVADAVVVATHRDLSSFLRIAGFGVHTHTVSVPPCQLAELWQRRIERARLGPGTVPRVSQALIDQLVLAHGTDLRAMAFALYERFQQETLDAAM